MVEFDRHKAEVAEKWGQTDAYREHIQRTKNYSKEKWNVLSEGLESIMAEFSFCMKSGESSGSAAVQDLVKRLQSYITENYYRCTTEILANLGQMYVADERFKRNIDKHAAGTAAFICDAITIYCKK